MELYEKYKTLFKTYGLNTPLRIAHFMAQCEHESGFKLIRENLNYRAEVLGTLFKKYFPAKELANSYAHKPQQIANRIYANRMGNGNEESGDGWKYRGASYFQITGKDNYKSLSKDTKIDFVTKPELLLEESNAILSALWYWNKRNLNELADKDNTDAISDLINIGHRTNKIGDAIGYLERKRLVDKWKTKLNIK